MPWPDESVCERWVDWSWYQNDATLLHRPFDVDAFCAAHPDVQGAIIRAIWPDGTPDKHYAHYYDGFERNGKKVMAYLWPNPQKAVPLMVADWKRALADRIPKAIGYDYEEASTFAPATNGQLTSVMRASWEAAHLAFPGVVHLNYSRGSWLDARIIAGEWIHDMLWWLAHYIWPVPDVQQTATSFEQMDALLPIGNDFTPSRGKLVKLKVERVVAWQFTSRLMIVPKGTSDGDYLLRSFVGQVFGGAPPPPPPPAAKVPVEIRVPAGQIELTVTET